MESQRIGNKDRIDKENRAETVEREEPRTDRY